MLTEVSVWVFGQRTVFFEVKAYKAADDTMSRDLFHRDDGGWLTDPAVLDPLHSGRLQAWPEGSVRIPATIAGDEGEAHAKLLARYQALEEEYAEREEFSNGIEVASENFEARPLIFDANERQSRRQGILSPLIIVANSPSIRAMSDLKMNIRKHRRPRQSIFRRRRAGE